MSRFTPAVIALALVLSAAPASPAAAQDAARQGYSTPAGQVQSDVGKGDDGRRAGPRQVSGATSSHLPFTGLDVGLLVIVGLGLLLVGAGLSRLTASVSQERRG